MADIDPTSMAASLATYYTQNAQSRLDTQTAKATSTTTALTKLKSALSTFDTALAGLTSVKTGVAQYSASFSSPVGTATASSTAAAGSYAFFVEKVATAHQLAFEDIPPDIDVINGGPLIIQLGDGSSFTVDLAASDRDGDGKLSPSEVARAINLAEDNGGKVSAMVVTSGGKSQLVLTSATTGSDGAITLDTSGLPASDLKTVLGGGGVELVKAEDAVVWLGNKDSGLRMEQSSNTFTAIEGVSVTFTQAMSEGSAPATLTVGTDTSGTTSKVQSFVSAYNALMKVLGDLTAYGDPDAGSASAVFASDTGVRTLKTRLAGIVRDGAGGVSMRELGISIGRDGTMALDTDKLEAALEADPSKLDSFFGSPRAGNQTGVLGNFDTYLDSWLNSASGQIARRQETVTKQQSQFSARQDQLDRKYDSAYARYLAQFTQLQTLTAQMSETSGLFSSLSTSSS